jgi:hypothetical protein
MQVDWTDSGARNLHSVKTLMHTVSGTSSQTQAMVRAARRAGWALVERVPTDPQYRCHLFTGTETYAVKINQF